MITGLYCCGVLKFYSSAWLHQQKCSFYPYNMFSVDEKEDRIFFIDAQYCFANVSV